MSVLNSSWFTHSVFLPNWQHGQTLSKLVSVRWNCVRGRSWLNSRMLWGFKQVSNTTQLNWKLDFVLVVSWTWTWTFVWMVFVVLQPSDDNCIAIYNRPFAELLNIIKFCQKSAYSSRWIVLSFLQFFWQKWSPFELGLYQCRPFSHVLLTKLPNDLCFLYNKYYA